MFGIRTNVVSSAVLAMVTAVFSACGGESTRADQERLTTLDTEQIQIADLIIAAIARGQL